MSTSAEAAKQRMDVSALVFYLLPQYFICLQGVGFGSFSDDEVDQLYNNQTNNKPVEVCMVLLLCHTALHLFLSSLFVPSDPLVLLQVC